MATLSEIVPELSMSASAGGSDDPEDQKGNPMPTISPDVTDDEESDDFNTDEENALTKAVKEMSLDEKETLKKRYDKQMETLKAKQTIVSMELRKHLREIKKEETKEKKEQKIEEKKAKTKESREAKVTVNVIFQGRTYSISISLMRGIGHLRDRFFEDAAISQKQGKDIMFTFGDVNLFETYHARKSLREVGIVDGSVVYASIRGVGGGFRRTIKSHLKPDAAKAALKEKINDDYKVVFTPTCDFPESFQTYLTEMRQSMAEIKLLQSNVNFPLIELALKQLSVENLQLLLDILKVSEGKRRGTSEERLHRALSVVFPKMCSMGDCIKAIEALQGDMTIQLFEMFIDHYGVFRNGEMVINAVGFMEDVKRELIKREISTPADEHFKTNDASCVAF